MEIIMRTRALLLALLIPVAMHAQVTYSLPATAVTLEVTAVKESFVAGPYAKYAKQYLGVEAPSQNYSKTAVTEIRISHSLVADMTSTFSVSSWKKGSKFLALTSQGLVAFEDATKALDSDWLVIPASSADAELVYAASDAGKGIEVPIPWEVAPNKPTEYLAKDAAEIILSARRERYNITIGNTDATFSGESLGAALEELQRLEDEYLPLFMGRKTVVVQTRSYSVCPSPNSSKQHYPVFAVSDEDGLLPNVNSGGTVYYMDFTSSLLSSSGIVPVGSGQSNVIHYRVPAICEVTVTVEGKALFSSKVPVYQLGRELTMPAK